MSSSDGQLIDQSADSLPLDVRISIDPSDECDCPPSDRDSKAVRQSITRTPDGTRICNTVLESEDGCEYERTEACDSCPCYLFSTQDCVAELLDIRDGRLHYSVTVPDRAGLAPLIQGLRETGSDVSVYRILAANEEEDEAPALTDKQREILELAIESGYYDRPRESSLDEIADELGITTSAASQRLSSVKRRLIRRYASELGTQQLD